MSDFSNDTLMFTSTYTLPEDGNNIHHLDYKLDFNVTRCTNPAVSILRLTHIRFCHILNSEVFLWLHHFNHQ